MRIEFADQYGICCLVLDGIENADEVIEKAIVDEATMPDVESGDPEWEGKLLYCLRFPSRPQELYTEIALRRSLLTKEPQDGKE